MIAMLLFLQVAAAGAPDEAAEVCGTDARCRVERARAVEAARRRAEYFRALAAYAQALEKAEEEALPHRERHPLGADFMYSTNLDGFAGVVGYTVAWPMRFEFFGGTGKKYDSSSTSDPRNGLYSYTDNTLHLKSFGFQGRFFVAPWTVSPVATLGIGWSSGSYSSSTYVNQQGNVMHTSGNADVGVHTLYAGLGLDWQWNWLHVQVGYRLTWNFYVGASDPRTEQPIRPVPASLTDTLENNLHGLAVEVGARY